MGLGFRVISGVQGFRLCEFRVWGFGVIQGLYRFSWALGVQVFGGLGVLGVLGPGLRLLGPWGTGFWG